MAREEFIVPPTFGPRCSLCTELFKIGDDFKSVWQKQTGPVKLGISVHLPCFEQLEEGDLGRIFGALEQRLALPIRILNGGRRVAVVGR